MNEIIEWTSLQWDKLYWYFRDFWDYVPEDIDSCCRR
jgi:hypothetical protein